MSKTQYPYYIPVFWRYGQMVKMYTSKKFSTFEEAREAACSYLQNPFLAKRIRQVFIVEYSGNYESKITEI